MMRGVPLAVAVTVATAAVWTGCMSSPEPPQGGIPIGVFLSYTGYLAADSINSERALLMAIEAANEAGGVNGQPLRIVARDTGSDPGLALTRTHELVDAGVALVIGPDTSDLAIASRGTLSDRTVILPSFATSDVPFKSNSWFIFGASVGRIACELVTQLRADGRKNPLLIINPTGYNSSLAWILSTSYGLPKFVLPTSASPSSNAVTAVTASTADAFVLAAFPPSAISFVYALLAHAAITDPTRWYLSPTLHSPLFLNSIPKGAMYGARGVSQGSVSEVADFQARFAARWADQPLDDAYPFYDAGAVAALSLQRALSREGAVPTGNGLSKHVIAVTRDGATPIRWNELDRGLERLRAGEEITYLGLAGQLEFDSLGLSVGAITNWWTVGADGFADRARVSECK
jgi:branched-chain amino acid transport system substrate-binding protein